MSTEIEALRNAIVNALYQVKCYDLPDACVSVGLGKGTSEEACSSKRGYVHSRIHDLDDEAIVILAGRVLDRH